MKKYVGCLIGLSVLYAQGMENKSWSITLHDTKINLNKGFINDTGDKVDFLVFSVFGRPQEVVMPHVNPEKTDFQYYCENDLMYRKIKNSENEKYSFEYWPYHYYIKSAKYYRDEALENFDNYKDEQAVEKISKNLAICYESFFATGLEVLGQKKEKSIAFATTDVGLPDKYEVSLPIKKKIISVLVTAMLEFIKNKKNSFDVYNYIELFVKKDFEFDLYKTLLENSGK